MQDKNTNAPSPAIKQLLCAIKQVDACYVITEGVPTTKIKKVQVERCFAYELYHQWRNILFSSQRDNIESKKSKLVLNGEITKYLDDERSYPDMVLHGGQGDKENQVLVCEIKRKDKGYPTSKNIRTDILKLCDYLELSLPNNDGSKFDVHFKDAAFIMSNIDHKGMIDTIGKSLNFGKMNDSEIKKVKDHCDKIQCISFKPKAGIKAEPEFLTLREILNKTNN